MRKGGLVRDMEGRKKEGRDEGNGGKEDWRRDLWALYYDTFRGGLNGGVNGGRD